jgi:phosphoesterase RecJ-like protein
MTRQEDSPERYSRLTGIKSADHCVLVTTHVQPDGDALGSLLAMDRVCSEQMGKRVFAYLDEPVSHLYEFSSRQP